MIYAQLQYDQHYADVHSILVELIQSEFENTEHGIQGDSWIWVFEGDAKVAIDTFTSMTHQVKSGPSGGRLVQSVIRVLSSSFQLSVLSQPELEPHEDV